MQAEWLKTHLFAHTLKKEHQISWKCILLWHVSFFYFIFLYVCFNLSAWAWISVANGLGDEITATCFCHLLWLLILNHASDSDLTDCCSSSAWVWNVLHSSLCLCVGVRIDFILFGKKNWRVKKEVKRMPQIAVVPSPVLFLMLRFSFISFVSFSPSQSVCVSVCLCLHTHVFSYTPPPHFTVHFPVLRCSQVDLRIIHYSASLQFLMSF